MSSNGNGNGNGNKVWHSIFEGLRLNWIWVVGVITIIAIFSGDRAVIIEAVKSSEETLSEINVKMDTMQQKLIDIQLTNTEKLGFLRTEDALIKQRLERIERNYENQ